MSYMKLFGQLRLMLELLFALSMVYSATFIIAHITLDKPGSYMSVSLQWVILCSPVSPTPITVLASW